MEDERFTQAWRSHRARIVDVAFRLLGDVGEAEDVAQEAFARFMATEPGDVRDERGWLTVVASRLCLDRIRSARSRRERPHELEELQAPAPGAIDPAEQVTLDDRVQGALLVLLQRLTPAERVAFVLHDVFRLPFDEIAATVGRTAPACRQLARRARQRLADEASVERFDVDAPDHRSVTDAFMTACGNGDVAGLLAVLDPSVSGDVDWGPAGPPPRAGRAARGNRPAAHAVVRYLGTSTLVTHPAADTPTLLAFDERRLVAIVELGIDGDRITTIHVVLDPNALRALETRLRSMC